MSKGQKGKKRKPWSATRRANQKAGLKAAKEKREAAGIFSYHPFKN